MSDYEIRGGEPDWRAKIAETLAEDHGWLKNVTAAAMQGKSPISAPKNGCPCGCGGDGLGARDPVPSRRHHGEDAGRHHAPHRDPAELLREAGDPGQMMNDLGDMAAPEATSRAMAYRSMRRELAALDDDISGAELRAAARYDERERQAELTRRAMEGLPRATEFRVMP